jgi:hypothetical protein
MAMRRGSGTAEARPASRVRPQPWRDPRLLVGVLLVLGATVLGARLVAANDDTVAYWAVGDTVEAGDVVRREHLEPAQVRLPSGTDERYLRTDEELLAPLGELVWGQRVAAGSLVARDALVPRTSASTSELPLNVAAGAFPADLARGDLVDVWVGPGPGDDTEAEARRVLEAVRVVESKGDAAAVGGSLARTVLVDVGERPLEGSVVSTVAAGHVTLVRVS